MKVKARAAPFLWVRTVVGDPSLCSRALEQRLKAPTEIKSQATESGEKRAGFVWCVGADCR